VFAAGAAFLARRELWLDEAFSYRASQLGWDELWTFALDRHGELNMVLYYLLLRPISAVTSTDVLLRMPSLVATLATIPLVWLLTRRLTDTRFERVAAVVVFVTQPMVVDYAFEARSYALMLFAGTGLTLLLLAALDGSRRAARSYLVLAPLIVGLHFVAIPLLLAHAVAVLVVTRGRLVDRLVALVRLLGPALLVASAALLVFRSQATLSDSEPLGLRAIASSAYSLTGRAGPLSILFAVALVAGAIALVRRRSERVDGVALLIVIAVPALVALALSLNRPLIGSRYLLHLVPLLCCVGAVGLGQLVRGRRPRIAALALFAVLGLAGQAVVYRTPDRDKPETATAYVLDHASPTDVLAYRFPPAEPAIRLAAGDGSGLPEIGSVMDPTFPTRLAERVPVTDALAQLPPGASVWVIGRAPNETGPAGLFEPLERAGYVLSDEQVIGRVTVERWRQPFPD
jgi:mannosyltransferase